jgi:uncharacterized protein YndB with AHSA1/START domain
MSDKPENFKLERSTTISAPPQRVFELIDDFHNWTEWSPWEGLDPELAREYSGPDAGVGAKYHWLGNRKVGEGRMENVESVPNERIGVKLSFIKPFKAENMTLFEIVPSGDSVSVKWTMTGHRPLFMRMLGKVFKIDEQIGRDFEKGLAQMKAAAEAS